MLDDRERIAKRLNQAISSRGIHANNIIKRYSKLSLASNLQEYSDETYSILRQIDGDLSHIPNTISSLLFEFGFPLPITDIEEYIEELASFINPLIKERNRSNLMESNLTNYSKIAPCPYRSE